MNTLTASVTSMDISNNLCALHTMVGNDTFELILVENPSFIQGDNVTLVFKETEVILLKFTLLTSSANVNKAIIKNIDEGIVLTSISLSYHESIIVSLITTSAFKRLELRIDDEVLWMVQPSEISLLRSNDGI